MKLLLISKVDAAQLFILNALTNSLNSIFKEYKPSVSLILISKSKIDDNLLFLEKNYFEVKYIGSLNQLRNLKKDSFDSLISIEDSILGLALCLKFKAQKKISFKRAFGSMAFNKLIPQIQKRGSDFLNLKDIENLIEEISSRPNEIVPKYHLENVFVRKNHEMIHWIYKTNYSLDLTNVNYLLMDLKIHKHQKKKQLEMILNLCENLIVKNQLKIIFIPNEINLYNKLINSSEKLTTDNLINSKQSNINGINHYPLINHSNLIITNKSIVTPFLRLIRKPFYLIKEKNTLLKFLNSELYYKKLTARLIGEISYMNKSI